MDELGTLTMSAKELAHLPCESRAVREYPVQPDGLRVSSSSSKPDPCHAKAEEH